MRKVNLLLLFILNFLFISCGSNSGNKTSDFSLELSGSKKEFQLGETLEVILKNPKNHAIDSVQYYFSDHRIDQSAGNHNLSLPLKDQMLGNQRIGAMVYYNGETDTLQLPVKIFNNAAPVVYSYKIIATFPHDIKAYTQGLEFYRDTLFESTGQYGSSTLRKTDFETGEVLMQVSLAEKYFGEGLSILNDKIYQLTWNEGEGLIYDALTLEKEGTFNFNQSKEGWGLCNDGVQFYKSDGTEKIWILNGKTLAEESFIQPTTHRTISTQLNELEWVEGKIYANTYQKDGVAIINPKNGAIEGLINFQGLREQVTQHKDLDVLNGIAYNPNTGKLYVTGKNWDKLFEVEIIRK